jgi:SAM-dependent methyltransferase
MGRLQLDFLVGQGLRPDHDLLDIGCGSLRAGVHLVPYLEPGRYVGIDINRALLRKGERELQAAGLSGRGVTLVQMGDFGFGRLGRTFDVALAQSVFTHLPLNRIIRCLMNVEGALRPGGRLFATFFENPTGKRNLDPIVHRGPSGAPVKTRFDSNPFHYDVDTFRWICQGTALDVEYFGDWNHPRDQKMLVFTKRG